MQRLNVSRIVVFICAVLALFAGAARASGTISGSVTDWNGFPLTVVGDPGGIHIQVYNSSGVQVYTTPAFPGTSGTYGTTSLPDGTYYIQTNNGAALGYIDQLHSGVDCQLLGCPPFSNATPVVIAGSNVTVNFALKPTTHITGIVTGAGGVRLGNVNVNILNLSGTLVTSAVTNASGVFSTIQLTPGASYLARTTNAGPLGYLNQVYQGVNCFGGNCNVNTIGTPITIATGAASAHVDFSLVQGGAISGTVTGNGSPLSGVSVVVSQVIGGTLTNIQTVTTNAAGVYTTTTPLLPGATP